MFRIHTFKNATMNRLLDQPDKLPIRYNKILVKKMIENLYKTSALSKIEPKK